MRMATDNTIAKTLRIGTRGSPLAMTQANMLRDRLIAAHTGLSVEIVPIKSAADWKKQDGEKSLSALKGGKGQFAKEIEQAHLNGLIDCGVHSLKDMPCALPEGLQITHFLPRANACDGFISAKYKSLDALPDGAVIGTCSPRRQALALQHNPTFNVVPFRGNVQTRLDKVREGQVDATFLAMAGLERLGIEDEMIHALNADAFLPACGQGIICVETKCNDDWVNGLMAAITCPVTAIQAAAEREVLKVLDGSCHAPIGAYAVFENNQFILKAFVASQDGQQIFTEAQQGKCNSVAEALLMGRKVGEILKTRAPTGILMA
jgi:hydroxymethylbilane synthase